MPFTERNNTLPVYQKRFGAFAATLIAGGVLLAAAPASQATPPPVSSNTIISVKSVPAGAPCSVTGYTLHARYRMATRDISEWDVENAVSKSCSQSKVVSEEGGTKFKYTATYVEPVLNTSGAVVAVYESGGSGGWRAK